MPQLDMACIKLKQLMNNPYAVERYTIMHAIDYEHPGWVEAQKKQRGGSYGRLKNNAR